jgi:hypothetical protein
MARGLAAAAIAVGLSVLGGAAAWAATADYRRLCDDNHPTCTEPARAAFYPGRYIGHDEPALLFYSDLPGSGNSSRYLLRLPKEPPILPRQNGSGGTFNFQLHVAFWFGMAICDSQSAPNPGLPCQPDTDANIFDNPDPNAADYIGNHPGAAFLELQFYPPGWVLLPNGVSCDEAQWCAALNIDSLSADTNTGQVLNRRCRQQVGAEYVNFAFITRNGQPHAPPNPVEATAATYTPERRTDLFMRAGDWLSVDIHDTPQGVEVVIRDLTSGQAGSMTASAANGFGQVAFAPTGISCDNLPYDFHPMYATSSEHTRVPWTAHSANIAFSDEIGHFENCGQVGVFGNCLRAAADDPGGLDMDDQFCLSGSASSLIRVSGCTYPDIDFDGTSYRDLWPGSRAGVNANRDLSPPPILFSSPLFRPAGRPAARLLDFDRIAFETDLPGIEQVTSPPCDTQTGDNCVAPPAGAGFYPFYSTRRTVAGCFWQFGGALLPGTTNAFGGSATTEYGPLLQLFYPASTGASVSQYADFRRVLPVNPCRAAPP